jgi:YggT family protein
MSHLIDFAFYLVNAALNIVVFLIFINALVSWLILFEVINLRNRRAYEVVRMLDRAVSPLLAPLRRFIPPLGGMDVTPVILIILIFGVQTYLMGPLHYWLDSLFAGPVLT